MAQIGIVTTAGLALIARGVAYQITRIECGSGRQSANPEAATSVTRLSPRRMVANPPGVADGSVITTNYTDDSTATYDVREMGVFATPTGGSEILFAYFYDDSNSATFLLRKTGSGQVLRQLRIVLATSGTVTATFASPINPRPATTGRSGTIELATQAEWNSGASDKVPTTDLAYPSATTSRSGVVEFATQGEVNAGSSGKVVTSNLTPREASESRVGGVEYATSAEVTARSGNGVVRAQHLPAVPDAYTPPPEKVYMLTSGNAPRRDRDSGARPIRGELTTTKDDTYILAELIGGRFVFRDLMEVIILSRSTAFPSSGSISGFNTVAKLDASGGTVTSEVTVALRGLVHVPTITTVYFAMEWVKGTSDTRVASASSNAPIVLTLRQVDLTASGS